MTKKQRVPKKTAELSDRVLRARARVEEEDSPSTREALRRARNQRSAHAARERQRQHLAHLHVKMQAADARIRELEQQVHALTTFYSNLKCRTCGQHAPCCVECTARALAEPARQVPEPREEPASTWDPMTTIDPVDPFSVDVSTMFLPTAVKTLQVSQLLGTVRNPFELSPENAAILREHAQACSREIAELLQ